MDPDTDPDPGGPKLNPQFSVSLSSYHLSYPIISDSTVSPPHLSLYLLPIPLHPSFLVLVIKLLSVFLSFVL
jgi:hypothetical protein